MTKSIEKGSFVRVDAHPEYGVGRVLGADGFVTRVLFPSGGLRIYRATDVARLKNAAMPNAQDLAVLDEKEATLARARAEPTRPVKAAAAKRAR